MKEQLNAVEDQLALENNTQSNALISHSSTINYLENDEVDSLASRNRLNSSQSKRSSMSVKFDLISPNDTEENEINPSSSSNNHPPLVSSRGNNNQTNRTITNNGSDQEMSLPTNGKHGYFSVNIYALEPMEYIGATNDRGDKHGTFKEYFYTPF